MLKKGMKKENNRLQGPRSISRHRWIKIGQQAVGGRHNGHWTRVWQVEADGCITSSAPSLHHPPFLNTSPSELLPSQGVSAAKYKFSGVPTRAALHAVFSSLPAPDIITTTCKQPITWPITGRRVLGKHLVSNPEPSSRCFHQPDAQSLPSWSGTAEAWPCSPYPAIVALFGESSCFCLSGGARGARAQACLLMEGRMTCLSTLR